MVAPEGESAVVDALASLWRLPGRSATGVAGAHAATGWSMFGLALSSSDIDFMNLAMVAGVSSLEEWSTRSVMASVLYPALVDGRLDPALVGEIANGFGRKLKEELEASAGEVHRSHSDFASMATLSLLWAGLRINDATGAEFHRDAGELGLGAYQLSGAQGRKYLKQAPLQAEWVAWMAANGDTRVSEALHKLVNEFAELDGARLASDLMNLRVQSNSVSEGATQ